jgi:hypothetical protein
VAVAVADFLAPRGWIEPPMFPQDRSSAALSARLNEYITQGQANVAGLATLTAEQKDDTVRAYVNYRAADAIVDRLAMTPANFSAVDQGSVSISSSQINTFAAKRDRYLDQYTELLALAGEQGPTQSAPQSGSGFVRLVW